MNFPLKCLSIPLWWRVWVLLTVLFWSGVFLFGSNVVNSVWGVKGAECSFCDARVVTGAWESQAQGYDPLVENPMDPWQRPMNYPRLWLVPGYFGWSMEQINLLGFGLMACFFLGWLVFPSRDTGWPGVLAMLLVGLSPAVILGFERGNIDLFMFFLLALAVPGVLSGGGRGWYLAVVAVVTAFMLKLYPLAGVVVFLALGRRKFWLSAIGIGVIAAAYLSFSLDDLKLINASTPRASGLSYGRNVLWMKLSEHNIMLGNAAKVASLVGVGLALVLAWLGGMSTRRGKAVGEESAGDQRSRIAFLLGAAVYGGTFVLGNNWDYRLVFLLFCAPWLAAHWGASDPWTRRAVRVALVCAVLSCWHMTLFKLISPLPGGKEAVVLQDEAANWMLFLALAWLGGRCAPEWLTNGER